MNPLTRHYADIWMGRAKIQPSNERLLEMLYLVHATDNLPPDGVLKAGSILQEPKTGKRIGYIKSRKTVHFAISSLVTSHAMGSWESKTCAVILPLQDYASKLFNLFPYDSYAIGNVDLNERCIVIVPQKSDYRSQRGERIVYFDPTHSKIRSVIEKVIQMQGGWKITLHEGMGSSNSVATLTHYPTDNLCELPFWNAFLEKHSHINFGPIQYTLKGVASHLKRLTLDLELFEGAILFKKCSSNRALFTRWGDIHLLAEARLNALKGHIDDELYATLKAEIQAIDHVIALDNKAKLSLHKSLFDLNLEDFIQEKMSKGKEAGDWEYVRQAAQKCKTYFTPYDFSLVSDEILMGACFTQLPEKKDASTAWLWGQACATAMMEPSEAHIKRLNTLTQTLEVELIMDCRITESVSSTIKTWHQELRKRDKLLPAEQTKKLIRYTGDMIRFISSIDRFFSLF